MKQRLCEVNAAAATSHAQQRPQAPRGFASGPPRPAVSPYLLLGNGGDPAINYYGLVRPQIAAGKAFATLGVAVDELEAASKEDSTQSGHRTAFLNQQYNFMTQGRYFMTSGATGSPGRGISPAGFGTSKKKR